METANIAHNNVNKPAAKHVQNLLINVDIYIAYNRLTQAEKILKQALLMHKENHAIMLKLLEVYTIAQRNSAFQIMFNRFKRTAPQALQDKAKELHTELIKTNPEKNFNHHSKDQKIQAAANLELAEAYLSVGDRQAAVPLLEEIVLHGDSFHREAASQLLLDQSA